MNIFNKNKVAAGLFSSLLLLLVVLSFVPDTSYAEGKLQIGETSGNGLWTRTKEFFSPYNNGENTYVPNTYGGYNSIGGNNYTARAPRNFYELIVNTIIGGMFTPVIILIISSAIVVFLWGVFKFVRSDGKEKESGKQFMLWGLVGIFVMISMWGLVNILKGTFNLDDAQINVSGVLLK